MEHTEALATVPAFKHEIAASVMQRLALHGLKPKSKKATELALEFLLGAMIAFKIAGAEKQQTACEIMAFLVSVRGAEEVAMIAAQPVATE